MAGREECAMQQRQLYRSDKDRMVSGVCGGLAEYFAIDTFLVRLIFVLLAFAHGLGLIAYVVLAVVVPRRGAAGAPGSTPSPTRWAEKDLEDPIATTSGRPGSMGLDESAWLDDAPSRKRRWYTAGVFLIVVGVLILLINFNVLWWLDLSRYWPLALIAIGLVLLLQRTRK